MSYRAVPLSNPRTPRRCLAWRAAWRVAVLADTMQPAQVALLLRKAR